MQVVVADLMLARMADLLRSAVRSDVDFVIRSGFLEAELVALLPDADVYVGGLFTPAMAAAARAVRLVQSPGAGVDQIAIEALPPGTVVANTYHHERAIAEYAFMAMVALSRRLLVADVHIRKGVWDSVYVDPTVPLIQTLRGRTVGIVGFGHIGAEVARLSQCFEMHVGAIKRRPDPSLAAQSGLDFIGGPTDMPRLLSRSDFVVVAAPLSAETRGMIGRVQLALMSSSSYLVNVARGAIVDEEALYEALAEHRIGGAALVVWYNYPADEKPTLPASLPFHKLDNVIMTPHHSGLAEETFVGRTRDVAANIDRLAQGKPLLNVVHTT